VKLLSVNAGQPREARWRGRIVRSAIWKDPVPGRVRVTKLHLEGDRQADAGWRRTLGELAWGSFGENLTTEGLLEDEVFMESRRCGFYCSVRLEGDVAAGDAIVWAERAPAMPTVTDLFVRS
jgi:MOSC domain-containing protein YiiM